MKPIHRLISVEGIECTGKTSVVVPGLAHVLQHAGFAVETSREPGGTAQAEKLRQEIFKKSRHGADQYDLAELFTQARKIHIEEVVEPFFKNHEKTNAILILDRYLDSTRVYQGLEGGVPMETIFQMEQRYSIDKFLPDLTIILYLDQKTFEHDFLQRRTQRDSSQSKQDTASWHISDLTVGRQRQEYYLQLESIAQEHGETRQFAFVNASRPPTEVIHETSVALSRVIPQFDNT